MRLPCAVQEVLNKTDQGGIRVRRSQETKNGKPGFSFWAWPYLKAQTLALFFTREKPPLGSEKFLLHSERAKLINCIKKNRHYETLQDETLQQAVEATRQAICTANPEVGHLLNHPTSGRFNKQWNRIFIPEDTVDVLELYTRSVLRDVGCTVHFVDAWHHHAAGGGVCRATNVLHEPPSSESRHWIANKRWWRNETDPVPDDDYDPTDTAHVAWHDAQEPNE